ncbi:MAG: tyrosine-type recombinase/integrase [Chloroflexi bacterium]|nr:tyrosine-type recombinase/integrase [Chloroflexota bacterium]
MTTLAEGLTAYRICAQAEGKSPQTIRWVTQGVGYFRDFLGGNPAIGDITGQDLRRFILACQGSTKYARHPTTKPQAVKLSPQSVETYARAIRAFFSYLNREELIGDNPMQKVKMPKVPKKVVPILDAKGLEKLLAQPDQKTATGFRDYTLMLAYVDTGARLNELVNLDEGDVDLDNGVFRVMGKGARERLLPFGLKLTKALLKYRVRFRPQPLANGRFFVSHDGRPLTGRRVERIISGYAQKAGLKGRVYPHLLRHTSSVLYLRNGGDPFSLQKKLGHSSLAMTRHYSELADGDVRAAHLKFGVVDRLGI